MPAIDLAARADLLVHSAKPGERLAPDLAPDTVAAAHPALGLVTITAFGQTRASSGFEASPIAGAAMGGVLYLCGSPDPPSLAEPNDQPYRLASDHGTLRSPAAAEIPDLERASALA